MVEATGDKGRRCVCMRVRSQVDFCADDDAEVLFPPWCLRETSEMSATIPVGETGSVCATGIKTDCGHLSKPH